MLQFLYWCSSHCSRLCLLFGPFRCSPGAPHTSPLPSRSTGALPLQSRAVSSQLLLSSTLSRPRTLAFYSLTLLKAEQWPRQRPREFSERVWDGARVLMREGRRRRDPQGQEGTDVSEGQVVWGQQPGQQAASRSQKGANSLSLEAPEGHSPADALIWTPGDSRQISNLQNSTVIHFVCDSLFWQ